MNTVITGNNFEEKSYSLIEKAIKKGELGIDESVSKVYRKKRYYSKDREHDIIDRKSVV